MLKLVQTELGVFDLQFDDPAAADDDAALATVIYALLFTDAEAPADRVDDAWSRRGWWADPAAGTGIWYVRWQALTEAARREAQHMVATAISSRDAAFSNVSVSIEPSPDAAGNISSVRLAIAGEHHGRDFFLAMPL